MEELQPFGWAKAGGGGEKCAEGGGGGAGKTFTMEGTEEERGVNFRALEELFRVVGERESHTTYK